MILRQVVVNNFRVFSGTHKFDLAPRCNGHEKPVVLFGGLNGSGKTTLLTSVRVGLYGRQALGKGATSNDYNEFLIQNTHKNPTASVPNSSARIELIFDYARQGVIEEYRVIRSWKLSNGKVNEKVVIHRNGNLLEEFNAEQCQSFLNELIPIGVSELFFFDGEKISDLAEDESGRTLQTAVKKLLGLDIIERTRNDIAIYLRRENVKVLPDDIRLEIDALESELSLTLKAKDESIDAFERLESARLEIQEKIKRLNQTLDASGGAWANTRAQEETNQRELISRIATLDKLILNEMSGAYPLTFAPKTLSNLLNALRSSADQRHKNLIANLINERLVAINHQLEERLKEEASEAKQIVLDQLKELAQSSSGEQPSHLDLSDSQIAQLEHLITVEASESLKHVEELKREKNELEKQLEHSSIRLERAPLHEQVAASLEQLKILNSEDGKLSNKIKLSLETVKKELSKALELNRKIERLHASIADTHSSSSAIKHARQASALLSEFSKRTSERRIRELEEKFIECYKKLARKEDLEFSAKIDPNTFLISLLDEQGNTINRNEISAGEKQIYAIAILEALAKTSGRKLPIIIDTPLGRLDSKHREKLVNNYFPTASHQVIILSTDTEIDEEFYKALEPSISHAYHIDFDEASRSSIASEGYFWSEQNMMEAI